MTVSRVLLEFIHFAFPVSGYWTRGPPQLRVTMKDTKEGRI